MKTFLSCFTAPFHRRFWNMFLLVSALPLLLNYFIEPLTVAWIFLYAELPLPPMLRNRALTGLGVIIFFFLLWHAYVLRMLRHMCLRGTADKLVAGDSVLPAFWTMQSLQKTAFVWARTFVFIFLNALLGFLVYVLCSVTVNALITYTSVSTETATGVFAVTALFWGFLVWFFLNALVANYRFVQTWHVWESWRIHRNMGIALRFFPLVILLCIFYVFYTLFSLTPVIALFDYLYHTLPITDELDRHAVTYLITFLVTTYGTIVAMAIVGRVYYYLRLKQEAYASTTILVPSLDDAPVCGSRARKRALAATDSAVVTPAPSSVVEPVVQTVPAKKAPVKKAPAKKAPAKTTGQSAVKKTPVKKATAKKAVKKK